MNTNMKVAGIFRAARKMTGKTQVEVAKHLGVSQSCVSKVEAGKLMPSVSEWFLFAQLVGIRPDESYHYGYIDHAYPVQNDGPYKESIFKIPPKYLRHPLSKVRSALPFIQYFRDRLGEAKWESYLEKEKFDPDFFLIYDGQLSMQFNLDVISKMIETGVLNADGIDVLARAAKDPAMHGRLQQEYGRINHSKDLVLTLVNGMNQYETNFDYQLRDQTEKGLVISVNPRAHLKEMDYKNKTLGDFLCRYKKKYFTEFSSYNGDRPVSIVERECHFHGSQQCIYQIQIA